MELLGRECKYSKKSARILHSFEKVDEMTRFEFVCFCSWAMIVMKSFYFIFNESNRTAVWGRKCFFRLLLILYTRALMKRGLENSSTFASGEMEIIVGRNLVRLESWFSRD